ncbi:hypothetical protein CRG98_002982 [Punica granatum]|uniref:Uncharacterized protein n=1 Tax=Punica granatum TaxID=22663 RepID=A0A2I0L7Q7_PUNGR|nr:hypothetical protein CRG98_002982 [Punica granatum]
MEEVNERTKSFGERGRAIEEKLGVVLPRLPELVCELLAAVVNRKGREGEEEEEGKT